MTPEHQREAREAFEADYFSDLPQGIPGRRRNGESYHFAAVQSAWGIWQAAWIAAWNRRAGERADVVPLSNDRIDEIIVGTLGVDADEYAMAEFARAIEAAHGIGIAASQDSAKEPQ